MFAAANMDIQVQAYDNMPALVRHWDIMLTRAGEVMRAANRIFPVKRRILNDLIVSEKIHDPKLFPSPDKDLVFAALAMCMTRQGFNGYYMKTCYFRGLLDPDDPTLDGKTPESKKRIAENTKVLEGFDEWDEQFWDAWQNKNISVEVQHWELTLAKHKNDFLFCDPPYIGLEDYYGQYETRKTKYKQQKFDHALLSKKTGRTRERSYTNLSGRPRRQDTRTI